jgi:hypothetical protein
MIRFALVLSLFASPALAQTVFTSSSAAQAHCPGDTIVWLNTVRHIYRLPGEKGYGRSKDSAYACEKEAAAAGAKQKKEKPPANAATPPANAATPPEASE